MKAPSFAYAKPRSLAEAFDLLARPGAEFPLADKSVFLELTRRQGDYAIVGLAGVAKASEKRIAFFGIGGKPVLMKPKSLEDAKALLPTPAADLYHTASTKLHLAKVLLERAWTRLN